MNNDNEQIWIELRGIRKDVAQILDWQSQRTGERRVGIWLGGAIASVISLGINFLLRK